jgi:hypothetical protein
VIGNVGLNVTLDGSRLYYTDFHFISLTVAAVCYRRYIEIQSASAAYQKYNNLKEGKHADYIPALAKVDPRLLGTDVVPETQAKNKRFHLKFKWRMPILQLYV